MKAKTAAVKTTAVKAKPAAKTAAKRAASSDKPTTEGAKPKATGAKVRKAKDTPAIRIGEPVLDPIGDVISGEARTYLGDVESQGKVEAPGQAEMEAYREETESSAADGTLEDGPGMSAAIGADATAGADEDEDETGAKERPPAKLERLQKILSQAGIASRRHAEEMIVAGRVMVNGQVVTQLGSKADAGRDHIRVDGKLLKGAERHRYFVLNKPKGYVTTVSDPEKRPTVMEFFAKASERLYPVGRLDYLSEGLLLMTNDGELANLLTKAKSGVEKVYLVKVAGQPTEEELDRLREGIAIERGEAGSERVRTSPARIRLVRVGDNPWYEVVLTEGRNRELRKMFAAIGHFAEKIRRVGYGPLVLDVEPGKLRELTADEVKALRLTAEGKIKPRRLKVDISLPKDAGRTSGKPGDRGARPWRDKPAGKRFDGPRGAAPSRGGKPFGQREDRGPRTDWKPREVWRRERWPARNEPVSGPEENEPGSTNALADRQERVRGLARGRAGRLRGSRHLAADAKAARNARVSGPEENEPGSTNALADRQERVRDLARGPADRLAQSQHLAPDAKAEQVVAKVALDEVENGVASGLGSTRRNGSRADRILARSRASVQQADLRMRRGNLSVRKAPFVRPAFGRPEGSFKPSDGPKKPFEGGRGAGPGAGKSFDRRTGSKARWVPRPGGAGNAEGRARTGSGERPAPAFGGGRSKEPGGRTREERGPHSAHAQVVSRDRASREGSQDPVVRGQVDFQSRAGRAAARIAVAPGLAASGRADGNSQIERPWNGE